MQHVSLSEGHDLVPWRCPSCTRLMCERVGRMESERDFECRACHAVSSLGQLVVSDPALGRVLSVRGEIRLMHGAV